MAMEMRRTAIVRDLAVVEEALCQCLALSYFARSGWDWIAVPFFAIVAGVVGEGGG